MERYEGLAAESAAQKVDLHYLIEKRDSALERVTELEAENEGLRGVLPEGWHSFLGRHGSAVHQFPDRGLIFTHTQASHETRKDPTSVLLTWSLSANIR